MWNAVRKLNDVPKRIQIIQIVFELGKNKGFFCLSFMDADVKNASLLNMEAVKHQLLLVVDIQGEKGLWQSSENGNCTDGR